MKAVTELDAAAARHDTRTAAGRMVWRAWGSGPPLVLLHGASGSWTHLARLMIAHRDAIDDLALFVQAQNVAQARFRSGTIPVSDVLVKALPAVRARIAGIWGARDAFAAPTSRRAAACSPRSSPRSTSG